MGKRNKEKASEKCLDNPQLQLPATPPFIPLSSPFRMPFAPTSPVQYRPYGSRMMSSLPQPNIPNTELSAATFRGQMSPVRGMFFPGSWNYDLK